MKLFSSFNEKVSKLHNLVFPYNGLTKELLSENEPEKILMQVARIINNLKNPYIIAAVKTALKPTGPVPRLVVYINVSLYGLTNEEKASFGEKLADLVGHHEGKLKHLSYNSKGFSYTIGYIGTDTSESCNRCAKAVIHIREASIRITQVVDEIKDISAARRMATKFAMLGN